MARAGRPMQVALTVSGGRISPVFDVAREVLVVEVCDRMVVHERREGLPPRGPTARIARSPARQQREAVMSSHLFKHLFRGRVVTGLLRSIGGAMLAGIGFKIGSDIYDAARRDPRDRDERDEADRSSAHFVATDRP